MADDPTRGLREAGEGAGEGLEQVGDALPEEANGALDAVKTASDTANAGAQTASDVAGAIQDARSGDVAGALTHGVGSVGGAAGAVGGLTGGVAGALRDSPAGEALETASQVARGISGAVDTLGKVMGAARALVDAARGGGSHDVEYHFRTDAYPNHRWVVAEVSLEEGLNEPYRLRIEVATSETDTEASRMLGRNCLLTIERSPLERRVCGLAAGIEEHTVDGSREARFTLEIVPAMALLAQRRDSRIFQNRSAKEILESVLGDGLGPYQRNVRTSLRGTYLSREYCVQFEETDLDFVHRLMEEEGIAYTFEHQGDKETVVLFDANAASERVETLDGHAVPFHPDSLVIRSAEPVVMFRPGHALTSTGVALVDHDWTQGGGNARITESESGDHPQRQVYEQVRALTITSYDQGVQRYQRHDAARQKEIRLELEKMPARLSEGHARVVQFRPGLKFELTGHPNVGADGEYLLVRVLHRKAPAPGDGHDGENYHSRFECIPLDVPYRPVRRTRKPRIHSMQTATVVGPSGEEIHTDEHGRIKVQFHWDRQGHNDDHSSSFVRVQQAWAGSGWGFVFIPRIGMEVLVSFLDGNPDRPLVIGSIYNGTNRPPYPLPDEKTKSTIKTSSSPGNRGHNELRFEDKAGREEIYVHAQKDYNEVVEHNHSTHVKANQSNTVDGDQTQTVHGKQTETIDKDQTMTVHKDRYKTIDGSEKITVHGKRTCDVDGLDTINLHDHRQLTIDKSDTVTVTGSRTTTVQGHEDRRVVQGRSTIIEADERLEVTRGAHMLTNVTGKSALTVTQRYSVVQANTEKIVLDRTGYWESAEQIHCLVPGTELRMRTGGKAELIAAHRITLQCGASKLELSADGSITLKGRSVQVTGETSVLKLEPAGATMNGPKVDVVANTFTTIKGIIVRIN